MGMNKRTVERMCATGELPAVKLRKKWLINKNLLYARLGLENETST
jgi:excisionase family DNA binding protein